VSGGWLCGESDKFPKFNFYENCDGVTFRERQLL